MDDPELEARLRTRLHARFDDAPVPPELTSNVGQALATAARPIGLATRTGRIRFGLAAAAAAVVIAIASLAIGKGLGPSSPGAVATPTPHATEAPDRWFVMLPPTGMVVTKPDLSINEVLSTRLHALGIDNFTSGEGYGLEFLLPAGDPSDETIRAVLGATGDVLLVPLPSADYGPGKLTATIGTALPKDEPPLFGWDGISAAAIDSVVTPPTLSIGLRPAAVQAFADYTTTHVGETFAIVVDGRVALLPVVMDPVTNGQLTITSSGDSSFLATAAILTGGLLPEAWRGASVPVIVSRDTAIAAALAVTRGGTVQDASPTVDRGPLLGSVRAVWSVDIHQPVCPDTESCVSSDLVVVVDAVTGTVISVGPQGS